MGQKPMAFGETGVEALDNSAIWVVSCGFEGKLSENRGFASFCFLGALRKGLKDL